MLSRILILACLALPFAAPPALAAPLQIRPGEDNDAMSLIWRDLACDAGKGCDLAMMGCRAPGEFAVSLFRLPRAATRAWMKAKKGAATLMIDGEPQRLTAEGLDGLYDRSGMVSVVFRDSDNAAALWSRLAGAKAVSLTLDGRSQTLAGGAAAPNLGALARACTAVKSS